MNFLDIIVVGLIIIIAIVKINKENFNGKIWSYYGKYGELKPVQIPPELGKN